MSPRRNWKRRSRNSPDKHGCVPSVLFSGKSIPDFPARTWKSRLRFRMTGRIASQLADMPWAIVPSPRSSGQVSFPFSRLNQGMKNLGKEKAGRLPLNDPPAAFLVTPKPPLSGGNLIYGFRLQCESGQCKRFFLIFSTFFGGVLCFSSTQWIDGGPPFQNRTVFSDVFP